MVGGLAHVNLTNVSFTKVPTKSKRDRTKAHPYDHGSIADGMVLPRARTIPIRAIRRNESLLLTPDFAAKPLVLLTSIWATQ
jgi:hypothetical protein